MRLTCSGDSTAVVIVLAAMTVAAQACGDRSAVSTPPDGGGDATGERPASRGDGAAPGGGDGASGGDPDAPGETCGAVLCSPGQVCCVDCDGNRSCSQACPGIACLPRPDGRGDGATPMDGGARSCAEAGGTCFCEGGPPLGYEVAPVPLSITCPQPPPGAAACTQACYLPVAAKPCTDKASTCVAGTICDLDVPGRCFGSTAAGTCLVKPTSCPQGGERVCGCHGKTYNNDCFRQLAGIQLDHKGGCVPGAACGASACGAGQSCCTDCAGNRFCEQGACSGVPSPCESCGGARTCPSDSYCATNAAGDFRSRCNPMGSGYCAPRPTTCSAATAPVCGCDGQTYTNDCLRRMAGVNLNHTGACP